MKTQDLTSKIKKKIVNRLLISGKKNQADYDFHEIALEIFLYQYKYNPIYHQWVNLVCDDINNVDNLNKIPFLPIQFFKYHDIKTKKWVSKLVFKSSGTTGKERSKHHLISEKWYKMISKSIFESFYSSIDDYKIIAILPSYLQNEDSSLIYMINYFIDASTQKQSGLYLNNVSEIKNILQNNNNEKILIWGVTYALMEIDQLNCDTSKLTVIETGGMKGRKKELIREDVHNILCEKMNITKIGSEYGMTELLSQAYSLKDGIFSCPTTMKVLIRDPHDPMEVKQTGKGVLNIIDLANVDTCSFIATDDLGHVLSNGQFEVIGRLDNSDIRGCNLMV